MSDTFLPGNGFDTYESQDKVLIQMADTAACAVAVRILQQQGFAVAGAAVRLAAEQAAEAEAAKQAAEKLGIECIVLNAEALAGQDADALARASARCSLPCSPPPTSWGCSMWLRPTAPGWRPLPTVCTRSARLQAWALTTAPR